MELKRIRSIGIIVCLALPILWSVGAQATTVTVGQGQQYATIQQGVNAGDIVQVYPGTYDESITIDNKSVTLQAVKGPVLTRIIGSGNGFTITATGTIQIQGFCIVKANNAIESGGTCSVYNCVLTGIGGCGYTTTRAVTGSVVNCLVTGCGSSGVWAFGRGDGGAGATIGVRNCVIQFNLGYGTVHYSYAGSLNSNYNCYFHNQPGNRSGVDKGTHDIDDPPDPGFRDPDLFDFRLIDSPPSVCIDAGDPTPGMQDPDGTRSDIGLYGGPYCATFWYGPLTGPSVRGVMANPPVVQYGNTFRIEGIAEIK